MAPSAPESQFFEALRALHPVDPEAYARARLGTMRDEPWVRAELEQRWSAGWEPLAAVDDVSHHVPRRMFELALAEVGPSGRILDFGAGRGSFVNFGRDYASVPNPIVAVDKTNPGLVFPPNVRFVCSDLRAFEWSGPPFDLALALHVLEQIPDTPAVARKLRGMLRPGAVALMAFPDGRWAHSLLKRLTKGAAYDEVHVYSRASFEALMSAAGFALEAWTCWPSYHSIHYGHVTTSDGRNVGELLDALARHFDHANGTLGFSCYGYGLAYRAV